ncbi:hypothetical protein POVWA1_008930 [Plasmodium ovale wallikeri]|uniref:Uncharacterized protein n=1 Tax=Plasmodium ovale wallikeri TaxID=864142 RepID=A0A1A8YJW3_PLAOA|nr:hypothetical protein POVWA1_008930 [Plasmodium ovale wallikeri]
MCTAANARIRKNSFNYDIRMVPSGNAGSGDRMLFEKKKKKKKKKKNLEHASIPGAKNKSTFLSQTKKKKKKRWGQKGGPHMERSEQSKRCNKV